MTATLVLGRFMPLHAGHVALIETAQALGDADVLTVMLCWQADDAVPPATRLQWLRETFPAARVVALEARLPGERAVLETMAPETMSPETMSPETAARLAAAIRTLQSGERGRAIGRLVAADRAQAPIAAALGARFVLIDPEHEAVPVRSAAVRADPRAHWPVLPRAVRPHYAATICLHGPESTGKSTLAPLLAAHFETLFVPEYGRTYCEQYGTDLRMDDLVAIGRTHQAMTQALLRQCNRRLILDTDPLMTAAWADMLFGTRDPWFDAFADTADLYLLLDIDLPWVDDGTRFFGVDDARRRFFDVSRRELERRGLPYAIIGGPGTERLPRALAAIAAAGL